MDKLTLLIVIPCYNEYDRLPIIAYKNFLQNHTDVGICFVNDASTDRTAEILYQFQEDFPAQVRVLVNSRNAGKAQSVRTGVNYCADEIAAPFIAYLDADLATSLEECYSYLAFMDEREFVFASRILKIGSVVERRFSRFLIGRIIATAISNILQIKVYDTQCGCKLFNSSIAAILFEKEFISKWLFDVELFSRILIEFGVSEGLKKMEEIPVKRWVDQGDSKVKLSYFFRLWYDLYLIRRMHRKGMAAKLKGF